MTPDPHACAQANILQPLQDIGTIILRQDALGELLDNDELLHGARQCLQSLPRDLDKMCSGLVCMRSWCCPAFQIVSPTPISGFVKPQQRGIRLL